ncbi:hypothetical protein ACFLTG_00240 [Chloroflexota bacterium]
MCGVQEILYTFQAVTPYPAPTILLGSSQIWTATSRGDSDTGTLCWALGNARSGDTITFGPADFSPRKPVTISLKNTLPYLSQDSLTIDASNAGVVLDGSNTPPGMHGLVMTSKYNMIQGLQISNFPGTGIGIAAGSYNTIGGDRRRGNGPSGGGNTISGNKTVGIGISRSITGIISDISTKREG